MKWEDFKNRRQNISDSHLQLTNIECPKCNEKIFVKTDIVLASYPPQLQYICMKCGWTGTA
jgi:DNA-directed RNA polymerase subunit RPC12/RpoP